MTENNSTEQIANIIEAALAEDAWVGHPDPLTAEDVRAIAECAAAVVSR